jgi:hypothetical protein
VGGTAFTFATLLFPSRPFHIFAPSFLDQIGKLFQKVISNFGKFTMLIKLFVIILFVTVNYYFCLVF